MQTASTSRELSRLITVSYKNQDNLTTARRNHTEENLSEKARATHTADYIRQQGLNTTKQSSPT